MGVYLCSSTKALLTKVVARCSCGTRDRFLVIGTGKCGELSRFGNRLLRRARRICV